jgi:succinate dehydrogenase/fumarate reductase flavoprotein subunit
MQAQPAVDWNLMTSVPGLFAAGANSGLEGSSYACSSGFYVGNRACEYAKGKIASDINEAEIREQVSHTYAPIRRYEAGNDRDYITWKELWAGSTRVMQQCCAEFMTPSILDQGLSWIRSIEENEAQHSFARNPHELARVMECDTRLQISKMYLHGCKIKLEMEKEKLPEDTYIFTRLAENEIVTRTAESQYWLKEPFAATYLENYRKCREKEDDHE